MATPTYSYNGKTWKPCQTTSGKNSFFHSAFGKRDNEGEAFFDKRAKFRRKYWGAFLTYFENTTMPSSLRDALKTSWSTIEKYRNASIEDPSSFEDYVSDVTGAAHDVVVGEIPILATLENIEIVVLSADEPNPIVIRPDVKILGDYPNNAKGKEAVVLCLEGNTFSRLEPLSSDDLDQTVNESSAEISDNLSSSLIKYDKGGSAGSKGVEYQVGILTVFLLNAFQKLKNWKLSTENKAAGKFDDVVLEWSEGAVLLQAKHKQNKSRKITLEDLLSTNTKNDDFSLPKYFLAYEEIKNKFKIEHIIICTNASVDKKILKFVKSDNIHRNSKLFYENGDCTYYTFDYDNKDFPPILENIKTYHKKNYQNKGVEETVITDDNIKDFLGRLEFYCNYPPTDDIMKVVEILISEMKRRKLLQGQISSLELYDKVISWFRRKKGIYLTETYAKAMFSEICKDIHCRRLEKYNVFFETNYDFQNPNTIYHITAEGKCLLQEIKIFQTLQKMEKNFLYVNLDDGVGELQQAIEAFKLPFHETLLLVWSQTLEESVVKEVGNVIDILNNYQYKNEDKVKEVILIAQSIETLPSEIKQNCSTVEGTVTFKDFSKTTQTDLMTRDVIFQGESFALNDLCGVQELEWYEKALDADALERLVRREDIKVGVRLAGLGKDISQFYMNRIFQNHNENFRPNIFQESFSEEFICGVNEKLIVISDIAGMGKSTVLTKLAALIKRNNPELWVIRINLNEYTRILSEYVEKNKQSITIEDLLNSVTETKLKNGLENELFSMQDKVVLMLDAIDEISPDYTTLVVDMLVQCQQEQKFNKIFLTTRPHLTIKLKSKLNVKLFELQPLIEENQIDFLARYWTHCFKLNEEEAQKCKQYARALLAKLPEWSVYSESHLSAIPLHLQMLAEIFQKTRFDKSAKWQGCKEYVRTDKAEPDLPDTMDLGTLYEMFIETKRELFIDKGRPEGNIIAHNAIWNNFDEYLAHHQSLALELIAGKTKCPLFSDYKEICTDHMKMMYKTGIVQEKDGKCHFVHKTFAEYFVAQSLKTELKRRNQNTEFQKFLIDEVLVTFNYNVICAFLNNFLDSILDELPSDIFQSYYNSDHSQTDTEQDLKFDVIHHLAEEGYVAILRLLFKCIDVKSVEVKLVEINQPHEIIIRKKNRDFSNNVLKILESQVRKEGVNIRDLVGRTPLSVAVWRNRLEMVKFLVEEKNADIRIKYVFSIPHIAIIYSGPDLVRILYNKMLRDGLDPKDGIAMYTAAYLGELDMLKELVDKGADLKCKVDKDETLIFAAARPLETIKYLVSQGVDVNGKDNSSNIDLEHFSFVFNRGLSKIDDYNEILSQGQTALHVAVRRGLLDVVKVLVDSGAKLDIADSQKKILLYIAAYDGNLDILKFLVDRCAAVCDKNTYHKAVMEAVILSRHKHILRYFRNFMEELGLDIVALDDFGRALLHRAANIGDLNKVKFIVKFDVDVNLKDCDGNTALYLAALSNKVDIVKYLVMHGADVNARNEGGVSLQHLFASINDWKMIRFLVGYRANLNISDDNGFTPLHYAVCNGCINGVRYLLEQGVDVSVRNEEGFTPLELAPPNCMEEMVRLFETMQ